MGQPLQPGGVAESNAVLQAVATALAEVAPIYVLDPASGSLKRLDAVDLLFGVFQRGATLLRTPKAEHRKLAVRGADMRAAIEAFRSSGAGSSGAGTRARATPTDADVARQAPETELADPRPGDANDACGLRHAQLPPWIAFEIWGSRGAFQASRMPRIAAP